MRSALIPKQALNLYLVMVMILVPGLSAFDWQDLNVEHQQDAKQLKMNMPDYTLSPEEEDKLYRGEHIAILLDSKTEGVKIGYLRFFAPFDPVTFWMVITDDEHFDLEDPSYPKTGSVFNKKRTFMPYSFDVACCVEDNESRMYQLLIMPLVAPRRLCLARNHDTDGFPWEASWSLAKDKLCCEPDMKADMKKFYDNAVFLDKSDGAWFVQPLHKKFQKKPADINRTDCLYFVDTNPGGDLGKMKMIVNKATSIALPKLKENVLFHCKHWEEHLKKYHSPEMLKKYHSWVDLYKNSMTAPYNIQRDRGVELNKPAEDQTQHN